MLIWVEHDKRFITSGQEHIAKRLAKRQAPLPPQISDHKAT